ncbi:DUF4129 domain-containing protein [Methermicoccus shengliensis]|uniref:DUF4129 domain-containing protein n=1 Tax=Methermicoccus shengliensis TaxID=660064 RepID=A0A832VXL2_9EURY|nr:DUF4129 domain-containing protein [Methermicoccus shengliensis]KUK04159.1 MAG: hypothetical protein XD46_1142 [Euryarchaeota archaeon 55_53]KUK29727.1 MAG: hypothetical protein XD62_1180 [Methanosarcinales archeaon 56_1174]MDN5294838.1 hypothetical protein [Methanosarcinales archaeon]HIH69858.1 DUF4129 domain-containing protein [Methermicoccus shengliensis]
MRVLMCLMLALVLVGGMPHTLAEEYPHHVNPAEIEKSSTAELAPFQYEAINGLLLRFGFLLEDVRGRDVEGMRRHYTEFMEFYQQNSLVMGTLDPRLRTRLSELVQFVNLSTQDAQRLIGHYQRAEQYIREGRRAKAVAEVMRAIDVLNRLNESSKMLYAPEFYHYPNIEVSTHEKNIELLTELISQLHAELSTLENQAFYPTSISLSLSPEQAGFGDVLKVHGRLYYRLNDTGIQNESVSMTLQNHTYILHTKAGGFYEEELILTQYLERGTTDVHVSYIPSSVPAAPAHARKPLHVLPKPTELTLHVAPMVSMVNISGRLTCAGIPLRGLGVKIVVDRFVYVVSTNEDGTFSLNVDSSKMERGRHTVDASFEPGPLAFLPSNATGQFELTPKLIPSTTPTSSTTPTPPLYSFLGIAMVLVSLTLLWIKRERVVDFWMRRAPRAPEPPKREPHEEEPTQVEEVEEASEEEGMKRLEEDIRAIEMMAEQSPAKAVREGYLVARRFIAERAGIEDDPTLTHREFLEKLDDTEQDGPFGELAMLYELCEFSGNPPTREQAKRALELVKRIVESLS